MSSRVIADDELLTVVLYDLENIIMRYRRLFNDHCSCFTSYYDWKKYVKVQRLFDTIESYCAMRIYHNTVHKPFLFVFKDFRYAYINSDESPYVEINQLLFTLNVHMKRLEVQHLRFYDRLGIFAENTQDVQVDIGDLVEKTMEAVEDKSRARSMKTITEKREELDYLLSEV